MLLAGACEALRGACSVQGHSMLFYACDPLNLCLGQGALYIHLRGSRFLRSAIIDDVQVMAETCSYKMDLFSLYNDRGFLCLCRQWSKRRRCLQKQAT